MSTTAPAPTPAFSTAGVLLEALADRDFDRIAAALADDVRARLLLPRGLVEHRTAADMASQFATWFGAVDQFELVDATVGEVGPRLHLRWRIRVKAERLGDGWFVVEQQAYADTDADDRIAGLSLLCSGYCPERSHA